MKIVPFGDILDHLHTSHAGYLQRYLAHLGCLTCVVEEDYVDKGYLIDYCTFHARSFDAIDKLTTRYHFFRESLAEDELDELLLDGSDEQIARLAGSYLGFAVLKPVRDQLDRPLLGRTVLATYPAEENGERRRYLTMRHTPSLWGVPLQVESLPFQTQDIGVGACATTALWVSLWLLREHFDLPVLSLAEITEASTTLPSEYRAFPSQGLTAMQMVNFIYSLKLEAELIDVDPTSRYPTFVRDVVRAYVDCGLPIIASLTMTRAGQKGYHAAVISGYRADANGEVKTLYVHDDQIGPYCRVAPEGSFCQWHNEWVTDLGYDAVEVTSLIVPVYPKIRLTFGRIYPLFAASRERIHSVGFGASLFLTQLNPYKELLLRSRIHGKVDVLTCPLPRFLWVIRAHYQGRPVTDTLYDATAVYPQLLRIVDYDLDT